MHCCCILRNPWRLDPVEMINNQIIRSRSAFMYSMNVLGPLRDQSFISLPRNKSTEEWKDKNRLPLPSTKLPNNLKSPFVFSFPVTHSATSAVASSRTKTSSPSISAIPVSRLVMASSMSSSRSFSPKRGCDTSAMTQVVESTACTSASLKRLFMTLARLRNESSSPRVISSKA